MIQKFFASVATRRHWWWLLLGINLVGSGYGFWWYREQLAEVAGHMPAAVWLVPDSPGSTFLLALFLIGLLTGRRWGWLGAVAFVANMKYGLWTATVLPYNAAVIAQHWRFDDIHLSLSHASMWVQGMLFARFYNPTPAQAWAALLFMWFQDFVDYRWLMIHPYLPSAEVFPFARLMAVGLSTIWGGFLVWQAYRHQYATGGPQSLGE